MTLVYVAATSAVLLAGLESIVAASSALALAGSGTVDNLDQQLNQITCDVLLVALPELTEDWLNALAGYGLPVVLLAEVTETHLLAAALRGSVRALLSPDAAAEEITAAIASAAAGLVTLEPATVEALVPHARAASEALDEALTPREVEVLGMLAEGLSNKLIAHRLTISEHTVKYHVTSIMAKLHAGSRTDAVMQGIRHGLILI